MRAFLILLCVFILSCMLWITITGSLDRGLFLAAGELWPDPWFKATLFDAYFSFIIIYLWVAYRERGRLSRAFWLLLFLCLGSMAAASYMLIQLFRLHPGQSPAALFARRDS